MALQVTHLKRTFEWNGKTFKDPNPAILPSEVLKILAQTHTEMSTATITGPEVKEGKAVYVISSKPGTLG